MVLKIQHFTTQFSLQTFQFRCGHLVPDIILFGMDGIAFSVIMVLSGILQIVMLPANLTHKITGRGSCTL